MKGITSSVQVDSGIIMVVEYIIHSDSASNINCCSTVCMCVESEPTTLDFVVGRARSVPSLLITWYDTSKLFCLEKYIGVIHYYFTYRQYKEYVVVFNLEPLLMQKVSNA